MTPEIILAALQITLSAIAAVLYGRQFKRHGPVPFQRDRLREWLRSITWLSIAAVSCGMAAWRVAALNLDIPLEYRAAGGTVAQMLYQIIVLIAYGVLKDPRDTEK